jgi:alpha-N-arabinofuranosidase
VPHEKNPILTQRHLDPGRPFPVSTAGHADFVQTPGGEWWAVFLGTRPYSGEHYNNGRETFLMPVRWVDGWPVITTGTETVPYVHRRPRLVRQPAPAIATAGNFTIRDEFDGRELPPHWVVMRTPRERWYDLAARPGSLTLRARAEPLDGRGQPSFIGRRQQHATASASTAMTYRPTKPGDRAGLVAFHNETHWFFLGVALAEGRPVVRVEERAGERTGGTPRVIASAPIEIPANGPIHLKIDARGGRYDFSYALRPGAWVVLTRDVDGTTLSTKVAGGFVGTMLGVYAYTDGR